MDDSWDKLKREMIRPQKWVWSDDEEKSYFSPVGHIVTTAVAQVPKQFTSNVKVDTSFKIHETHSPSSDMNLASRPELFLICSRGYECYRVRVFVARERLPVNSREGLSLPF